MDIRRFAMKRLLMSAAALSVLALAGCVVAPARGYYYGPARAVAVFPPPVVVVRP
jgi:hypothetical protein